VGQAGLARRGDGPPGLAGLLAKQPVALGRRKQALMNLAFVEGA
jgi:hypothetical protein